MKSTTVLSWAAVLLTQFCGAALATATSSAPPTQTPSSLPKPNERTSQGCFHAMGNLTSVPVTDMSSGKCNSACVAKSYWVTALQGSSCYCGFAYPPKDSVVADDNCNYPCPNYPLEACGGLGNPGYFSVFNTGININVENYDPPTTSSSVAAPTSTSAPASVPTSAAPAVTTTAASSHKSSTNTAAVAAGVVSGVVVIAALIAGCYFYMRRKRNAEVEEEHRRNAAVNAFISGSKPPSSSGSISMTDSRLDPVMAHRRMSDGSIADNQDYSRRILRVTNA